MMGDHGFLHRMQITFRSGDAFDGGDRKPIYHRQKQDTGIGGLMGDLAVFITPCHHNRTRPAIAFGTAFFTAGHAFVLPQPVEQGEVSTIR